MGGELYPGKVSKEQVRYTPEDIENLINKLRAEAVEEEAAFKKYYRIASDAGALGLGGVANELRTIGIEEKRHRDTLNSLAEQLGG